MNQDNSVSMTNATVGGKMVGRDDKSLNVTTTYSKSAYIEELYQKFQEEMTKDPELKSLCEELDYLNTPMQNETVVGLESKLTAAGRQSIVLYATELKEAFFKKLMKTAQYSLVAQDVNVYILTKIKRTFILEIFELIVAKESHTQIQMLIADRIIKPVMADLGINLFKYTEEDVMGMIFYLTGNCHLKWAE